MTPQTVVMVTTSYPRFPGDLTGTFLESIAHGVADRGHIVHIVAPWHPLVTRPAREGNVHFHFYRYAPVEALTVFGYASALKADTSMRPAAYLAAPFALFAGHQLIRRVIRTSGATVIHAHWVIPSGAIATFAAGGLPLVVSLHGSDIYVAERHSLARTAARYAFSRAQWVTACSEDLRQRAIVLGADGVHSEVVPYGVDVARFTPDREAGAKVRTVNGIADDERIVLAVGRLVRKKGFEYLIDAVATLATSHPALRLVIAGSGDLGSELRRRAIDAGIAERVTWLGAISQNAVADWLTAADIVAVPSLRDATGNVDGLPNVVLEALASATPLVATTAGGIGSVIADRETALAVPERDARGLARAIETLLGDAVLAARIGNAAREHMRAQYSWSLVAERFETAYDQAARRVNRP